MGDELEKIGLTVRYDDINNFVNVKKILTENKIK